MITLEALANASHGLFPFPGVAAGELSLATTVGAVSVGLLFAIALAAYLFYKLFPLFFGTPLLGVLKQ